MKQPNTLAWLVLYAWPAVVLGTFAIRRSSGRLARTTAWMMILPVMFLPPSIELPFAALDKHRIAVLAVAAALALFHRRDLRLRDGWRHFPFVALAVFCLAAPMTFFDNTAPIHIGILKLPGLGPRDIAWMIYEPTVEFVLPFMIGQRVFKTERDVRDLFEVLSLGALIYAPLCLIELRLSPQLSNWTYGYFPHSFAQMIRGAGYRPIVFMSHALAVGMFLYSGLCAALTLRSANPAARATYTRRSLVAAVLLLLARNLASLVYSAASLVLLLWGSIKTRTRVSAVVAALVLAYPALRASSTFPAGGVAGFFQQFSRDRSQSLAYRFHNEDLLLSRAMQRPMFGWGSWGRNRVYTSWGEAEDPWAGAKDISTTDGAWIIWLGISGAVGFAARFAMLVAPVFRFARNRRQLTAASQVLGAGLALMIALFTIDLLPNALWDLLPVMYAGVLFATSAPRQPHQGRTGQASSEARRPSAAPARAGGVA